MKIKLGELFCGAGDGNAGERPAGPPAACSRLPEDRTRAGALGMDGYRPTAAAAAHAGNRAGGGRAPAMPYSMAVLFCDAQEEPCSTN